MMAIQNLKIKIIQKHLCKKQQTEGKIDWNENAENNWKNNDFIHIQGFFFI